MKPFILRQAWFFADFQRRLAELANFLLQEGFKPEVVQQIFYPAKEAIEFNKETGERIDTYKVMKEIARRIVFFGKKEGIRLENLKRIPYIDSRYFNSLLLGLENLHDTPLTVKEHKLPKVDPKKIKTIQREMFEEQQREKEAEKGAQESRRKKVIEEVRKLFKEPVSQHLSSLTIKFIQKRGK